MFWKCFRIGHYAEFLLCTFYRSDSEYSYGLRFLRIVRVMTIGIAWLNLITIVHG